MLLNVATDLGVTIIAMMSIATAHGFRTLLDAGLVQSVATAGEAQPG